MNDYLKKILKGQAINYEAFLKKLPDALRRRHRELFATEKVGVSRWRVTILDEVAFAALQQQAAAPVSRVDAAKKGDSHRHGTEVSFLLVYHHALIGNRPDSVVITGDSVDIGFRPAPRVLVVENERNFYHYRQMLAFAGDCLGQTVDLTNSDVVLGGGNRITGTADLNWLTGYDEVLCAFDYDAGGLQMFSSVQAALGDKACFLQPADWQPWLSRFRKTPDATERFTNALSLAEDLGFVSLAQAFRATGKFMEQEMILDE
ncbi:Wadjet anti-phage system protein JetD domain-containing protein [uncultured Marinobacter sp.]|uniref:Wadjet anti-phage system protein JetD domain-containing protein n=1 Tax=uncultured Marinobacter sp. TaxID=187379 RepID=UPI002587B943|nr:Wadjet anti-phage system protein JetD domain-containing protein [uncultured Marinobacter sp.]